MLNETILNSGLQLFFFISVVVFLLYILSKIKKVVKFVAAKKKSAGGIILLIIILGIMICLASQFAFKVNDAQINIRDSIAVFAAVVGGPVAGILVGLIGAVYRYMIGGWTAVPCSLATFIIGIIAAFIVAYKKIKPSTITEKQIAFFILLAGVWEIIHLLILVPWFGQKSFDQAFSIMSSQFVIPMVIFNMIAIATYLLVTKDAVQIHLKLEKLKTKLNLKK